MSPRTKWLLALLGVMVAFLAFQRLGPLLSSPPPASSAAVGGRDDGPPRRVRRGGSRGGEAEPVREVEALDLAALDAEGGEYSPGRNPFTFGAPPPPPPPPPPPGPTPEELAARRAAAEAARQAAAAEPTVPRPPPVELAYLGSFGPSRRKIAVFTDGESIYNALEGEVLDGKFRLLSIGYESVELEFVGFPDVPPAQLRVGLEGT